MSSRKPRTPWRGQQRAALPALIALLDRDEVVPLTNTADLIYPGAKQFFGHGFMVDYDLDRLSARAGWALEQLTFENFGFSEGLIREDKLLQAVTDGAVDAPLRDVVGVGASEGKRASRRAAAVERAKEWYAKNGASWSRFQALQDALKSGDRFRQLNALSWLRSATTPCDGLTQESYRTAIEPLVKSLSRSSDEGVRGQAELLLKEGFHR